GQRVGVVGPEDGDRKHERLGVREIRRPDEGGADAGDGPMNRFKGRQTLVAGLGVAVFALLVLVVMVMPKMSAVGEQQKALTAAHQTGDQPTTQVAELQDA